MGIFSRFERHMEDGVEGAANKVFNAPLSPVQISKKAERAMHREKMVGAGQQYAPTLYTVLVSPQDNERLWGYYPTLAGETETYLSAKAAEEGFLMDGQPLVRFICDDSLRRGKFDVVAELVSAPIIAQLRQEEMQRYGLAGNNAPAPAYPQQAQQRPVAQAQAQQAAQAKAVPIPPVQPVKQEQPQKREPLPYVPESEIDRSIDYGEYTFNSQDWDDYQQNGPSASFDFEPSDQSPSNQAPTDQSSSDEPLSFSSPLPSAQEVVPAPPSPEDAPVEKDSKPEKDLSGLDVNSYDLSKVDSRDFDIPSLNADTPEPDNIVAPDFDVPGIPMSSFSSEAIDNPGFFDTPNTAVFAAGAAQVDQVPNQVAVRAHLINLTTNQRFDLASNQLTMGRGQQCDIPVDDSSASRSHAQIRFEPQGVWAISDLGSTNGTLVNNMRITGTRALQEGDRIRIGTTDFTFALS